MAITEYEDQIQEIVSKPDHSEFIYDFLSVYDIPRATVTKLRKGMNNLAKEAGAVYLKNKLYFRVGAGDLMQDYADLQERVDELGSKPRYLLVTDYQHLLAKDTETNETLDIEFAKLPQYFDFFLAWNGIEKADFDKENPADVRAAERFAKLYDVVKNDNPNATPKGLNLFLIRILFCLFAEDTNIFEHDLFTNRVKQMTADDGSDFDQFIGSLFGVLDFEKAQRPIDTPSWLNDFPYVDGDLFKDQHESLHFSAKSRKLIIEAGELLKWDQINPDILGSMIQAVASEDSRSHLGMHYTSVPNIMKVIKPLFLDGLREDFEAAKGNENRLQQLYDRIGKIKFMDPACGSGNFLIITYKELRQLEIDILIELNNIGVSTMYVPSVTLDQFYGIEIDDFACDVTRLSLWIAEHQMNVKLHEQISDAVRPTLPLQHAGAIENSNALRLDWNSVVRFYDGDEVFIFGNPPYLGSTMQNAEQKADMKFVLSRDIEKYKNLDYIACWFVLAAKYAVNRNVEYSFVSTNSICQGEQVSPLWSFLLHKLTIKFAYQSFEWKNNAKKNAAVIVVIVGLTSDVKNILKKRLILRSGYSQEVTNINAYLEAGPDVIVQSSSTPENKLPKMVKGSQPTDGGGLIFSKEEYEKIVSENNGFNVLFKKFVGSKEYINGIERYVLWINKQTYNQVKDVPFIRERMNLVINARTRSKNAGTVEAASTPYAFQHISKCYLDAEIIKPALIVPSVSSENRIYAPMGITEDDTIISNLALLVYDAPIWLLGLLQSRIHMVWLRNVGGKLKNDYRYSANLVYNTFPVPELSTRRKNEIETLTYNILDIREEEGGTIADLYGSPLAKKNPKPMNERLLRAHKKLDAIVDRAYKSDDFNDDGERLTVLLKMYADRKR
ncbi:DNA methyltransferase [Lapidilactobacillus achengensis]|uniref:site-specific DNA-methyltransferase (adenine-specific) n=1 Tax=Lapidilactobacillus achengensis TaxID=2486000 RepID=A0ABW1UQG2_9LACO|nr:DNA methyltransferase [Lapidilactobacillus achengensis]